MKQFCLAVVCCTMVTGALFAQNDTMRTLFQRKSLQTIGLYVAPEVQYGAAYGDYTPYTGASAALVFNQRWELGIAAYRNALDNFSPASVSPLYARTMYGGVKVGYTFRPSSLVHVGVSVLGGGGYGNTSSSTRGYRGDFRDHDFNRDSLRNGNGYGVVQPAILLEMNLFRWAKLFANAGYRFAFNDSATATTNPLQGASGSIGLKLGLFDWNIRRKRTVEAMN